MIKFIEHKGNKYPNWQAQGNAARWIMPLAIEICRGTGLDIGYSKEMWMLKGAIGIEPSIDPEYDAMTLPKGEFDYIFSSHCLEHIKENWANVLDYWMSKIRDNGALFLYLPHSSQSYWHPTSNRKHIHSFSGDEIRDYLQSLGYEPYITPVDYNNSFAVVCYKTKVEKRKRDVEFSPTINEFTNRIKDSGIRPSEIEENEPCIEKCVEISADYCEANNSIWYKGQRYTTK